MEERKKPGRPKETPIEVDGKPFPEINAFAVVKVDSKNWVCLDLTLSNRKVTGIRSTKPDIKSQSLAKAVQSLALSTRQR